MFVSPLVSSASASADAAQPSKKTGLLAQLALTSHASVKFFLRSPPASRRKTRANYSTQPGVAPDPVPGRALVPDFKLEFMSKQSSTETDLPTPDEDFSPTLGLNRVASAALDFAMCDLVSLDSLPDIDQGIHVVSSHVRCRDISLSCPTLGAEAQTFCGGFSPASWDYLALQSSAYNQMSLSLF